MDEDSYIVVLVTVPNRDVGVEIARSLINNKLAACVNVIDGLRSIYYWEGRVEENNETLLIIKSRRDRLNDLVRYIRERHPYKVPEIIALPIIGGLDDYLRWIGETLNRD
ncbi:MAG: divalent-cation tolerance protein CutA [Vulcanisaeta sp.]|jgi:periplasmic divalent cation tolerance protein|uniref:Periplasmic divalent cation tolerance protein n=1 Tax=Vulcanisaeta moutnovskia (strain 768-28) TaxID=985053 RepID=F0QWN1_VULM7|nr:divalent-cation tolerance protein CutA [Vulcanisaeta moutnovskia]ADY02248.1 periplasmic divalent cation tolerance protein [Vulcanisaeta moutnovskia 768-28]